MKRIGWLWFASALGVGLTQADAAWLSQYSGYTVMSNDSTANGIVNFAVYETKDTDWTDDFETTAPNFDFRVTLLAGGSVDKDTKYVMFYQVMNTDESPPNEKLKKFTVANPYQLVTSMGYVLGHGFQDSKGKLALNLPTPNSVLGEEPTTKSDDIVNGVPTATGRTPVGPISLGSLDDPSSGTLGTTAVFNWRTGIQTLSNFPRASSLLWLTVDSGVITYGLGTVGGASSDGDIPIAAAEPNSLALLLVVGIGAVGLRLWRRRRGATPADDGL